MSIQEVYDTIADDYASKRKYPAEKMKLGAEYLMPGLRVLDLGCGPGRFFQLIPEGCEYIGLDFSKELLKIAQQDYPQGNFVFGDMTDESVWHNLGNFDRIFSFASFHHLMTEEEQKKVLRLAYNALNPTGLLMVVVWNLTESKDKKVLEPWKVSDGQKVIKTVMRPCYAFTPEELKTLAEDAGFNVKKEFFTYGKDLSTAKEFGLVAQK